jgi:hypothetical protein
LKTSKKNVVKEKPIERLFALVAQLERAAREFYQLLRAALERNGHDDEDESSGGGGGMCVADAFLQMVWRVCVALVVCLYGYGC